MGGWTVAKGWIGDNVNQACEQYGKALLARHEGSLPAADAAELDAHLVACGACRQVEMAMKGLFDDLESLGESVDNATPKIDLTLEILAGAAELRAGRKVLAPLAHDHDDIAALLAGDLDDFGTARLDRESANDPLLAAELASLFGIAGDLEALGATHAAGLPRVDLAESILARAKARAVEENIAPQLLDTLPQGIRLAAERFIEASATTQEVAELRAFAATRPELATLLTDAALLHTDLEAIALEVERQTPKIDVLPEVMAAARKQSRPSNITPMHRPRGNAPARQAGFHAGRWLSAMAAAAALVLFGLYLGQALPGLDKDATPSLAGPPTHDDPMRQLRPATNPIDIPKTLEGEGEQNATPVPVPAPGAVSEDDPATEVLASGNGARTLKEVLDARRAAFESDQEALARLVRWSSLSEEEARKIVADKKSDPAAILGAAEFLPADEAAALLKKAIVDNPNDPALRKALAKAYADSGHPDLAREQLDAWSKLDPENSLPKYLAARMAFNDGNSASGLSLLGDAAAFEQGSLYSAQSAQNRSHALGANGYDPTVARFLAGSTAGTSDYNYAQRLASDLMDQGNQLRDAGLYDDAEKVYLGVYNLGAQLSNSAQMANDFSTAYDIQNSSLQALVTLSQIFAGVDPSLLSGLLGELNNGMQALTQLLVVYNSIFSGDNLDQIMALIAATLNGTQLDYLQR